MSEENKILLWTDEEITAAVESLNESIGSRELAVKAKRLCQSIRDNGQQLSAQKDFSLEIANAHIEQLNQEIERLRYWMEAFAKVIVLWTNAIKKDSENE